MHLSSSKYKNLTFVFKNLNVDAFFIDDGLDFYQRQFVLQVLNRFRNYIEIDKTYVDFEDAKYSKVFIEEKEWNKLLRIVYKSNTHKKLKISEYDYLIDTFRDMILSYLYICLEDFDIDVRYVNLLFKDDDYFIYEVYEDNTVY